MKKLTAFGIWIVFSAVIPVLAQIPVDINVDYATFRYDDSESMVELYLSVGSSSLGYEPHAEDGFLATLPIEMSLWRATDATLEGTPEDAVWKYVDELEFSVADTATITEGQYHVMQLRMTTLPNEYELRVKAVTPDGREVEVRRDLIVPVYADSEGCIFSDITLATAIGRSDNKDDPFYKNGLAIRPNATGLYGEGTSRLMYYAEGYNPQCAASDDGTYTLLTFISGAASPSPISGFQRRTNRQARPVDVLAGSFDMKALPSGSYFLNLVLLNEANEAQVEQYKKFFVFNPSIVVEQEPASTLGGTFETSEYAVMPEEEVNKSFEHIAVVAAESERRRMDRLQDLDEKRRFLREFWMVRDPDPNTPANEYKEEFYSLLSYANERYSSRGVDGWQTDRGRVMIKYGQPESIEPRLYEIVTKPHEIWTYNSIPGEGQAIFIFADVEGYGIFDLIHSTASGERKLVNWIEELSSTRF